MSESERTAQRIAGMSRVSAGSVFHAAGTVPITAPEVIAGLIQRAQRDAEATNKATAKAQAEAAKLAADAKAVLDLSNADGDLSNKDLAVLIRWKLGPRGGASQYKNAGAWQAAWATLKDAPTPEPKGEEASLPYAEGLALLVQQMAAGGPSCYEGMYRR